MIEKQITKKLKEYCKKRIKESGIKNGYYKKIKDLIKPRQ